MKSVTKHPEKPSPVRAITTKKGVTLVDIVSTRMLGQHGFLAKVFHIFSRYEVSIDVIATSEVSVSLTVDHKNADLSSLRRDLAKFADVAIRKDKAIVTIICDVRRSSQILAQTFNVLAREKINIQMISQGASKVNISMICNSSESERVVRLLHAEYFGLAENLDNGGSV